MQDAVDYTLAQNGTAIIEEVPSWLTFFEKYVSFTNVSRFLPFLSTPSLKTHSECWNTRHRWFLARPEHDVRHRDYQGAVAGRDHAHDGLCKPAHYDCDTVSVQLHHRIDQRCPGVA